MMTKTIKIKESTYNILSNLASKKDTFDDVINYLIDYYVENEEFSDEEAKFYNEEIENFEKGKLDNVSEITIEDLEKRIAILEKEIKNEI